MCSSITIEYCTSTAFATAICSEHLRKLYERIKSETSINHSREIESFLYYETKCRYVEYRPVHKELYIWRDGSPIFKPMEIITWNKFIEKLKEEHPTTERIIYFKEES